MRRKDPEHRAADPGATLARGGRTALRALAAVLAAPMAGGVARGAGRALALAPPAPAAQLHVTPAGELLVVSRTGALWRRDRGDWRPIGEGLDPRAPITSGHARIAGRAAAGGLWVSEAGRVTQASAPGLMPYAGFHVLPFGIIACAEAAGGARAVRLEPGARGWHETARSGETVLPDARPLQVDLDRPPEAAGDGHIIVLGGPDAERYRHAVLGDGVEATRVLYLERHDLRVLRSLSLPAPYVLEDISPRPLAWRGATGLLTMRSGPQGAQLAVVAADRSRGDALAVAALGPPIGVPNRWLAATSDGRRTLAVLTPHIGGVLVEYSAEGSELRARAVGTGYSTHALGSRELDLAVWIGGVLVLPSQDRRSLVVLATGDWSPLASRRLAAPVTAARAWRAGDRDGVAVLLADGSVAWVPVEA